MTPVALAAIPVWTLGGASLAGLLQMMGLPARGDAAERAEPADGAPIDDAVRAAALFALLLELQGRDEAAITRILDGVLPDDADEAGAALGEPRACADWLDEVRHRLDLALAREVRP